MDPYPADLGTAKTTKWLVKSESQASQVFTTCNNHECPGYQDRSSPAHPKPARHEVPLREPCHVQLIVSGVGGRGRQECWALSGVRRMKLCRVASPSWSSPLPPVLPLLFIKSPPKLRSTVLPVELGPGQDPTSSPSPGSWTPELVPSRVRPTLPLQTLRPRSGEGPVAPSGLILMQGTARRSDRQQHTKAVPLSATQCQPRSARRLGGPDAALLPAPRTL